ncbi:MAG TPA: hypothetical protein ENH46_04320 [Candidatus Pacearchaeota archaeon]|nr:hypothetical protein [Candidatus Pacearchaeota archaeon]
MVKQCKNTNTIVILGSGSSINEINEEQWKFIKSVDTIGINKWFIHNFIPTYYHYETYRYAQDLNPLLRLQEEFDFRNRYQNVLFFTSELDKKLGWHPVYRFEIFPNNAEVYTYPGYISKKFRAKYKVSFDDFSLNLGDPVWRIRGSLTSVIHLAIQIGYKKIILSGVDLNNQDYFFDKFLDLKKYGFYFDPTKHSGIGMHPTVFASGGKMGVVEFIEQLSQYLLDEYDIKLFVSNKKSLLYKYLPYHNLQ